MQQCNWCSNETDAAKELMQLRSGLWMYCKHNRSSHALRLNIQIRYPWYVTYQLGTLVPGSEPSTHQLTGTIQHYIRVPHYSDWVFYSVEDPVENVWLMTGKRRQPIMSYPFQNGILASPYQLSERHTQMMVQDGISVPDEVHGWQLTVHCGTFGTAKI